MNKHGFTGVRKRMDGRSKPFYARFKLKGKDLYSKSHETADEAAKEYQKYKSAIMRATA